MTWKATCLVSLLPIGLGLLLHCKHLLRHPVGSISHNSYTCLSTSFIHRHGTSTHRLGYTQPKTLATNMQCAHINNSHTKRALWTWLVALDAYILASLLCIQVDFQPNMRFDILSCTIFIVCPHLESIKHMFEHQQESGTWFALSL